MNEALIDGMAHERDQRIAEAVKLEGARLRNFIRRRVPDERDAEDVLQEVFYELVEADRMMKPIEQLSGWLANDPVTDTDGVSQRLEDLLPSPDAGPEAAYTRTVLIEELDAALNELPEEQRQAFVAHEIEGQSFKELAEATGGGVNTLILRKHRAVVHLRERLEAIYDEFEEREEKR
jgi:RNA polymerase sigma factor (sigma-70 family)